MDQEQALRERLAKASAPPSRVSIDSVLPAAQRAARRRQALWAGAGVALAVGALVTVPNVLLGDERAPAVTAAPSKATPSAVAPSTSIPENDCRMRELPVPKGMTGVEADGIDPTGRYIVGHATKKQDFLPILWTDGKPEALPMTAKSVQLSAVNPNGVVVGLSSDGTEDEVFRYANGTYTTLRMPPGEWHPYPEPVVNAAGDVLINAEPRGNIEGKGAIVLLWKAGSTEPVRLPLPKGAHGSALADDGTIAGAIYSGGAKAAYVWDQQGTGRKLKTPAGQRTAGYAMRGDWVTGGVWEPGHAGLWNLRTGALTEITAGDEPGEAVNASGWALTAGGRLIRDGRVVELPGPGAGRIVRSSGLSDGGLVVGGVELSDGLMHPRVWQC
ncbi:hypothetical protein GCM10010168_75460 [Actinoplanes ianthinogenes]|uniref:Uncharacterized protein n=1 Tax=Actinoplanes ianthinogenes TaxID=122358 RepID=A0ABM7LRH9_9ACTN|nr:hypothetical protein [Actinoplanes ianthinogenes]BCJ41858.1 hypothetical protein Aiant_25150 [Actinoplanes ianthinogenes]GGR45576.1 hypothetical protein GCM10010168_75460 [Actinoplanes ianthinogenes]